MAVLSQQTASQTQIRVKQNTKQSKETNSEYLVGEK